jgi:hypothetical protein
MVIARGEFIYELEKNIEFRQRFAEGAQKVKLTFIDFTTLHVRMNLSED